MQRSRFPLLVVLVGAAIGGSATSADAQQAFRFQFPKGQVLQYRVEQQTSAEMAGSEDAFATVVNVKLVKRWEVTQQESDGQATLQLSFPELRFEQTTPTGSKLVFDSKNPGESHAGLAKQLGALVGRPVQQVVIAADGSVVSQKSLVEQSPIRQDLPFFVTFPNQLPAAEQSWNRSMPIPQPEGLEGEWNYTATQTYSVKQPPGDRLVVSLATQLPAEIANPQHELALLQYGMGGTVSFDPQKGVMMEANLSTEREVELKGAGSYRFQSTHTEKLLPAE